MVSVNYDLRKPNRYPAEETAGGTYVVIREFEVCYRAAQTKPEKSRQLRFGAWKTRHVRANQ
ncbi:MAG: hypothetical protein LBP88_06535 [Treponema sp.]|jgi:hypothetical protein|nr:hypothetical protein [Treponema sp.]